MEKFFMQRMLSMQVQMMDNGEKIQARIYAVLTSDITNGGGVSWKEITKNLPTHSFWMPEVDSRSTGNVHNVISFHGSGKTRAL